MRRKIFAPGARGFTLVELMIAGAIAAAISGGAFAIYNAQQISYLREEQFTEAQQNIRAAMYFMEKDVRMAGYDPYGDPNGKILPGFIQAKIGSIGISHANDNALATAQSAATQTIIYALADDPATGGYTGTGIAGGRPQNALTKTTSLTQSTNGGPAQPIIDNVEAVEFLYHLRNGKSTTFTSPDPAATSEDLLNVLSVEVTLLVRSRNIIKGYTSPPLPCTPGQLLANPTCQPGAGWVPAPDFSHYLHYMLTANMQCRNLVFREKVQ